MLKNDLQKMCEKTISSFSEKGEKPRLLLHACCAPCSSYVTEYLIDAFDLTLYFYNPNISPADEFEKRYLELKRFVHERFDDAIPIICPPWNGNEFSKMIVGTENAPEGGERCRICYRLRLESTAAAASALGFPLFCTTLSVSPYKNAEALYLIGTEVGEKYGVTYLPSDFKKKDGYKKSIEYSRQYSLYRQNFCGCSFSKSEADKKLKVNF